MKYEITYSCGHEGVKDLIGKQSERDRKIRYYETQCLCPECARKKRDEENKALGVVLHLTCDHDTEIIEIIAYGDTYAHKEELKKLGFRFGEISCTFLNTSRYGARQKCWSYTPSYSTPEELKAEYDSLVVRVKEGVTTHVSERKPEMGDISLLNKILLGRKQELERKDQEEKEAEAARQERARQEVERKAQEERNKWKRVAIPAECARNIGGISGNIRIKFPAESRLAGYSFVVANYCVFEGSHDGELYLELYRSFEKTATKLKRLEKKNKQGKWYELVEPVTIHRADVIECFGNEVDHDAPKTEKASLVYDDGKEEIHHTPEPKTPVDIDAAEELKR